MHFVYIGNTVEKEFTGKTSLSDANRYATDLKRGNLKNEHGVEGTISVKNAAGDTVREYGYLPKYEEKPVTASKRGIYIVTCTVTTKTDGIPETITGIVTAQASSEASMLARKWLKENKTMQSGHFTAAPAVSGEITPAASFMITD